MEEGWALKKRKSSERLSENTKKFVVKKFKAGSKDGQRKMDAAAMARLMVLDDTILPADRMNTQQI